MWKEAAIVVFEFRAFHGVFGLQKRSGDPKAAAFAGSVEKNLT